MADYESDHVFLANAQTVIVGRLQNAGVPAELFPAWDEFCHLYDPLIRRYARACGVAENDLEDAAQSAWLVIIPDFIDFECDPRKGSFRAWLFVHVRNSVVGTFRSEEARPVLTQGFDFTKVPGSSPEPCCVWEREWNEQVFAEALALLESRLSKLNNYLFMMRHFYSVSVSELADETRLDRAVIRARVYRAKKAFERILNTGGYRELLFPV